MLSAGAAAAPSEVARGTDGESGKLDGASNGLVPGALASAKPRLNTGDVGAGVDFSEIVLGTFAAGGANASDRITTGGTGEDAGIWVGAGAGVRDKAGAAGTLIAGAEGVAGAGTVGTGAAGTGVAGAIGARGIDGTVCAVATTGAGIEIGVGAGAAGVGG